MLTVQDLTAAEKVRYDEAVEAMRICGASPAQTAQTLANKLASLESLRRPRGERALGAGAFVTSKTKWSSPDSVRFFSQDVAARRQEDQRTAAERDPNNLRREISREHRRLSTEGGDPSRLTELLTKKRKSTCR